MDIDKKIEKIVIEEIDETGDINLGYLIPFYKQSILNRVVTFPLDKHNSNYSLSNYEMDYLQSNIVSILKSNTKLGLFRFVGNKGKGFKWNDSLNLIDECKWKDILSVKQNWILKDDSQTSTYYIAERE